MLPVQSNVQFMINDNKISKKVKLCPYLLIVPNRKTFSFKLNAEIARQWGPPTFFFFNLGAHDKNLMEKTKPIYIL